MTSPGAGRGLDKTAFALYRIQDADGRGPFRPGFSKNWADENFGPGVESLPTIMEDFGETVLRSLNNPAEHYGTAVRKPIQLCRWFSKTEMERHGRPDFCCWSDARRCCRRGGYVQAAAP